MEETRQGKSATKLIVVGIAIGLILSCMVVYFLVVTGIFYFKTTEAVRPPSLAKPEIMSTDGYVVNHTRGIPEGPVFIIDVSIVNRGDAGWIKVCAIIYGYGRYEIDERETELEKGSGILSLVFNFDMSDWELPDAPQLDYHVWVGVY